ncbi:NAD-dependent epimerase/dehydratase family protein [Christiangramia forsetii]|uniref:Nucleoside-diphosphate-sugar epimerase n=2 Tax=Christiangramia forsetii TaxID=411153 RepID=A0LXK5_CHRFK|nr:NAD-dependent epimerase/dehydratase family protein [Christiangramia forsetii]GGG36588.1 NAD-dependent epimerase [Christiangramia forsetii]CAL65100.1 nucleoside-diphosphate-sugar epimerase [Christiangramia forsetii KT0803]
MILVTGGTGLVGSHLLYELAAKNEKLRATIRPSSDIGQVRKVFGYYSDKAEADRLFNRIEWVTADINDIPSLNLAFEDISRVYHSAALVSFDPSKEAKLRKINIEGTANIVNLCIANNISKLCYVSSIAAIGSNQNNSKLDETSKWNPEENHNDYAISKYGAEIEVWRSTQEGIDAVIINPGVIIGPGFWNSGSGKIFSKIDNGLSYHFPKITGFVGVQDVVKSMIALMKSPIKNEQFIVVSENLSFETVFKETATYMGKSEPTKQLKKWMITLGWIFQKIGSWFGGKRQITRDSINGLYEKTYFDNTKIKQELNFEFTPMSKVLEETSSFYTNEKP